MFDAADEPMVVLQSIVEVGVEDAVEVLKRAPELKLTFGMRAFRDIIVRASKAGNLTVMKRRVHIIPQQMSMQRSLLMQMLAPGQAPNIVF